MSSSAKVAGGDIQLSVDRAGVTTELEQLRATVRTTFAGMSDDALKFASAQDRLDRALKASNGKITSSVRSAEVNLRRVQTEALRSSGAVTHGADNASRALQREERSLGRLTRGAIAGSGIFSHFGRSIAFASSAFLGGTGLVYGLKASTEAATEQQAAEGQLETALKNRGQAVESLRGKLNGLVAANAKLGFGELDVTKALTLGTTAAGSLEGATRLLSVAQNISRAKGIDLYSAMQLLVKGFLGASRGIKALGVDVRTGAKGWEVIDAAQAKYAGRAQSFSEQNAGAFARERAELERTKVTIGNELLPAELALVNAVSGYLGKAENQARIQRDVNQAVKIGGHLIHDIGDAYDAAAPVIRIVNKLLGGSDNSFRLIAGSFVAMKLGALPSLFNAVRVSVQGAGAAAAVSAGEFNALAAAEERAAAAGKGVVAGGGGGVILPPGVSVPTAPAAPVGPFGRGAGGPISGLGALGISFLGGVSDEHTPAPYFTYRFNPPDGSRPVVFHTKAEAVAYAKKWYRTHPGVTAGQTYHGADHSDTRLRRGGQPLPGGKSTTPPAQKLDRLTQINLDVQEAQTAVARGDKGATDRLIAARRAEIAYDIRYEKIQQNLERTDPKHLKQHAEILQRLLADEESARADIKSIEDERASKAKASRDKRAAAAARAHRAALASHRQALASRLGGIETQITNAQTAEQSAGTVAKLKLAQARERHARELLVAFYVQESKDTLLTKAQRATARKNAAKARQDLQKIDNDDRGARLKLAVETAENAVLAATEGTAAYDRAIAAEKKALAAEIAYFKAREHNAKLPLAAQRSAVADELAARKKMAALDKKTKTTTDSRAEQQAFLGEVQRIIGSYSPNFFPQPTKPVSGGKAETHLYSLVNELRRQTPVLHRIATANAFPVSGYAVSSAVAALG